MSTYSSYQAMRLKQRLMSFVLQVQAKKARG